MSEKHSEKDGHSHKHGGVFGEKTELYFAVLSGVFFFLGLIIEIVTNLPGYYSLISFMIAFIFGGWFTTLEAIDKIKKGEFEIDFLMLVAAAGAAYIDRWEEGALLLFLFSLGHALESYAMNKAKKSIEALGELSPKNALVKREGSVLEIPIEDLQLNDIIVIKPNTKIAADGVIIKGNSSVNQASITGESMPVDKVAIADFTKLPSFNDIDKSNVVFTGAINGDNTLEVQVLKMSKTVLYLV